MRKIRVAVIFGGRSAEHEVALQSAKSVIEAIDREKYDVVLIGIDKSGKWRLNEESNYLLHENDPKLIALRQSHEALAMVPGETEGRWMNLGGDRRVGAVDVVFPVLHGPFGEDGTMQGLLKLADVAFVGAGVLGSAVGMDKDVAKRLLRDAGIPTARFLSFSGKEEVDESAVIQTLGFPLFVKPANLGSSVGIRKVKSLEEFGNAVDTAFFYDRKILVEEFIAGREIEVAVLGNESPEASIPGEIKPSHEFYSYEAKYIDEHGAALEIPAQLSGEKSLEIRNLAVRTFKVLGCEGMARVDFFLKENGDVYVNEINTIPGFTSISMYPKLWEASGIPYQKLIDRLIQLALDRHEKEKRLKSSFESNCG